IMLRRTTRRTPRPRGPARLPLRLEALEDRTVPTTFSWKPTAPNSSWSDPSNWDKIGTGSGTFPDAVGDTALFINAISASRTITLSEPITIGTLQINDGNSYTF